MSSQRGSDESFPRPYQSARDLPSFVEMQVQLRGLKALTWMVRGKHRQAVAELEAEMTRLASLVDGFYAVFGSRHWVFHDSLNVGAIEEILNSGSSVDEMEKRLVSLYQDPDTLRSMTLRLKGHAALRSRHHLISHAIADYAAGRYYSTVLVLLAVMDGFVNDFESARRGLHARDDAEMQAWDSVVGHHLGLGNAHRSFTKSVGKTTDVECFELHRNGIIHGTILNFDNVVVATKAWNRLLAVADWAYSREREQQPVEPQPTWRETLDQVASNARQRKLLDAWRPSVLAPGDQGYEDDLAYRSTVDYLSAWQAKNYGRMAAFLPAKLRAATDHGTAGQIRSACEFTHLTAFTVGRLHFEAAAVCEVDVMLAVDGQEKPGRLRWICEAPDGKVAIANEATEQGEWRLYLWEPLAILNRAQERWE